MRYPAKKVGIKDGQAKKYYHLICPLNCQSLVHINMKLMQWCDVSLSFHRVFYIIVGNPNRKKMHIFGFVGIFEYIC